jgi:hypothetical protein
MTGSTSDVAKADDMRFVSGILEEGRVEVKGRGQRLSP